MRAFSRLFAPPTWRAFAGGNLALLSGYTLPVEQAASPLPQRVPHSPYATKPGVDWEGIKAAYCAGVKSDRQIGAEFGVSGQRVGQRAKSLGWIRNLEPRIQAVAKDKAARAELALPSVPNETQVIEAAATTVANVHRRHRRFSNRARDLAEKLFDELEAATDEPGLADLIPQLMAGAPGEESTKSLARMVMRSAIALPQRVETFSKLVGAIKTVVSIEREAYGIGEGDKPPGEQDSAAPSRPIQFVAPDGRVVAAEDLVEQNPGQWGPPPEEEGDDERADLPQPLHSVRRVA